MNFNPQILGKKWPAIQAVKASCPNTDSLSNILPGLKFSTARLSH